MKFDVTAAITAHREDLIAYRSIRNALFCKEVAAKKGIKVEVIATLDRPNEETIRVFNLFKDALDQILFLDHGDLALSRNSAAQAARGKYLAFLDADDLWSSSWLVRCFEEFEAEPHRKQVFHPEYSVFFGAKETLWQHKCQTTMGPDDFGSMLFENHWTSLCFTSTEILRAHPYADSKVGSGFGFEDWHWNCETMGHGIIHRVIPETAHFVRKKANNSLLSQHRSTQATFRKSSLFENLGMLTPKLDYVLEEYLKSKHGPPQPKQAPVPNPAAHVRSYTEVTLPDWVVQQLHEMSSIENEIFPTRKFLDSFSLYTLKPTRAGRAYSMAREMLGNERPDFVLIAPWIKKGGADLAILMHLRSLRTKHPGARVAVITTENSHSTWRTMLPEGVAFIELGRICSGMRDSEVAAILTRLLVQTQPRTAHVIQSRAGWTVFQKFGKALSESTRLFASVYLDGVTEEGAKVGYARSFLFDAIPYLTRVFSDNQTYINELIDQYGYDPRKFQVLYHPFWADGTPTSDRPSAGMKRFLWAGRIDRQKRPELAIEIARKCGDLSIDMYGDAVLDEAFSRKVLSDLPSNVRLRGEFNGLQTIPIAEYDALVYTSDSDGMPNILIEAASLGIPIIAPDVGGIRELVDEKTGYLVPRPGRSDDYIKALRSVLANREEALGKAIRCRELIRHRHSWDRFSEVLEKTEGYWAF